MATGGSKVIAEAAQPAADSLGGEFLSQNVKGSKAKEIVCAYRLAPVDYIPPVEGYIPYRHDTCLQRQYSSHGGRNCLMEGLMFATGMGVEELKVNTVKLNAFVTKVKFDSMNGPSMGMLDQAFREVKSPFRLPSLKEMNANLKWTTLSNMTEGIYLLPSSGARQVSR